MLGGACPRPKSKSTTECLEGRTPQPQPQPRDPCRRSRSSKTTITQRSGQTSRATGQQSRRSRTSTAGDEDKCAGQCCAPPHSSATRASPSSARNRRATNKVARPRRSAANRAVHAKRLTGVPESKMTPVKWRRGSKVRRLHASSQSCKTVRGCSLAVSLLRPQRRGPIRELETAQTFVRRFGRKPAEK